MDIQQLQNRIDELEKKIEMLESANTIPLRVDQALQGRGFLKTNKTLVSSSNTTGSANTQGILISAVPATITVPAQPSGTIAITINGTTYNVLYQ